MRRQDASGNTQTYGYDHDSFGNLTEITVGDIVLAEYVYGPQNGYLLEQSYGNGDSIAYEYDNLGRTTKATYSSGRELSYTYTGDGQVHSIVDNNGTTDTADDLTYAYTYDTLGRTVDSQMCRGIQVLLKTHWEYDDANRIQSQSWQVGTTGYKEVYTYDEDDGSLVKITVEGDIQDANLIYDALRRLHQVTTDTYTKTYSYRDISSTRTTTQITGLSYTGLFNHTFGYTYDALGYIDTYSPKAGETIQYDYDAQGQLTSVTVGDQKTVYTYDSVGNILSVKQGDASADPRTYSTVGSYTYGNNSWRDLLTKYNGGVIAYEGQTYNAETNTVTGDPISGNPISYFNGTRWTFDWENGRQLTSASATVGNTDIDISYTYDFDGLRTSKTVTYTTTEDSGDEEHTHDYTSTVTAPTCLNAGYTTYTCTCGDSYTDNVVDALGHSYVQSGDTYTCSRCGDSYTGHQHAYTERVITPTCVMQGYTIYTCSCGDSYNGNYLPALGHDSVVVSQTETMITYMCNRCGATYQEPIIVDPNPPVEYGLRNSNVTVTTEHHEYIYASGTLLREVITTTDADGNVTTETLDFVYDLAGSPYALNYTNGTDTTQTYYYITNVQGDVTHLVAADGTFVAEYGYDAWGKVTAATGTMAEVNPLRYRGYYADAESGFYYVSSRYYDPVVCRFVNADEAALVGANGDFVSLNLFAYCGNNPASRADIEGFFWHIVVSAVVGGVVSAICTAVTGGSLKETATSFLNGAFEGAIGTACPLIGTVLKIGQKSIS